MVNIGMICRIIFHIFRTVGSFARPYRIYSSLPVVITEISACIEVCVNMVAPVCRCLKVYIIVITVDIKCTVSFCPGIFAASLWVACPVNESDCLGAVNISVILGNLEVVAVILSAVSVGSVMQSRYLGTECVC